MNRRQVDAIVIGSLFAAVVPVAACRREPSAPTPQQTPAVASTTLTGEPQDMAGKQVQEVIPTQPQILESSRVGLSVGSDGMVTAEQTEFKRNQPIRLSMWLKESPPKLQTSAVIFDENDQKLGEERKPMDGGKTVTFTFDSKKLKLKPGMYRIVGYWGGNIAAEYVIKLSR